MDESTETEGAVRLTGSALRVARKAVYWESYRPQLRADDKRHADGPSELTRSAQATLDRIGWPGDRGIRGGVEVAPEEIQAVRKGALLYFARRARGLAESAERIVDRPETPWDRYDMGDLSELEEAKRLLNRIGWEAAEPYSDSEEAA